MCQNNTMVSSFWEWGGSPNTQKVLMLLESQTKGESERHLHRNLRHWVMEAHVKLLRYGLQQHPPEMTSASHEKSPYLFRTKVKHQRKDFQLFSVENVIFFVLQRIYFGLLSASPRLSWQEVMTLQNQISLRLLQGSVASSQPKVLLIFQHFFHSKLWSAVSWLM